jgi:branched-chain amino acid transport system ATP-binding protein
MTLEAPAAAPEMAVSLLENRGSEAEVILETRGVSKRFDSFTAVSDVSWRLRLGEAAGIIGPNGAGKTTFFNLLTGMFPPNQGSIRLRGEDITRCPAHGRVLRGLVRTFQLVSVFDHITVRENMVLATILLAKSRRGRFFFGRSDSREISAKCDEALQSVGLESKAARPTLQLSYGEKRKLEIALALALRPRVLLLDEPFAGLSDGEIVDVLGLIRQVKANLSLVIIEHKISRIVDLVSRLSVMHEGRVIADGVPQEVLAQPMVRQVYWGRV